MTRNSKDDPRGVKLISNAHLIGLRPVPRLEIAGQIDIGDSDIQIHVQRQNLLAHLLHELCDGIEDGVRVGLEVGTSYIGELFRLLQRRRNSRNVFWLGRGRCVTQTVQSSDEQGLAKYPARKSVHNGYTSANRRSKL